MDGGGITIHFLYIIMTDFERYNKIYESIKEKVTPIFEAFKQNPEGTFRFKYYISHDKDIVDETTLLQMIPEFFEKEGMLELGEFPCYGDNGPFAKPCLMTREPCMVRVGKKWNGLDELQFRSNWKWDSYNWYLNGPSSGYKEITFTILLTWNDLKRYKIYEKYAKYID